MTLIPSFVLNGTPRNGTSDANSDATEGFVVSIVDKMRSIFLVQKKNRGNGRYVTDFCVHKVEHSVTHLASSMASANLVATTAFRVTLISSILDMKARTNSSEPI